MNDGSFNAELDAVLREESTSQAAEQIIDFSFRPKVDKTRAKIVLFGLLIASLALVTASVISPLYKGLISLVAVVGLIGVVYVFSRYIAAEYAYVVMMSREDNVAYLTVTKTTGGRVSTVSTLELSSIESIKEVKCKEDILARQGERKYNFCPSLRPEVRYALRAKTRYEKLVMLLEITPEVRDRLLEYSKIAKAIEPEE